MNEARANSHGEEVLGLLWAILATQLAHGTVLFWIAVAMCAVSLVGAVRYAIQGIANEQKRPHEPAQSERTGA